MKKIMLISILSIMIVGCQKDNIVLQNWVVWRAHDRVKFFNSSYDCHGYVVGTKLLYKDLDDHVDHKEHVDSLILHYIVPDSVDRDYIVWKYQITSNEDQDIHTPIRTSIGTENQ